MKKYYQDGCRRDKCGLRNDKRVSDNCENMTENENVLLSFD